MEDSLNKGIIIDFFGLPGSGKTTIADRLVATLQKRGFKTIQPIHDVNLGYGSLRRIITKIMASTVYSLSHPQFMYELFANLERGCFRGTGEAVKLWINTGFVLYFMTRAKSCDFLVADQGIAQIAISLTINCKRTNIETIIKGFLDQIKAPVKLIYIHTDIHNVLERLEHRPYGRSRVDKAASIQEKTAQLRKIQSSCSEIASNLDCLIVDNNQSDEQNDPFTAILQNLSGHLIPDKSF